MADEPQSLPSMSPMSVEYAELPSIACQLNIASMQTSRNGPEIAMVSMQIRHHIQRKSLNIKQLLPWNIRDVFWDDETNRKVEIPVALEMGRGRHRLLVFID